MKESQASKANPWKGRATREPWGAKGSHCKAGHCPYFGAIIFLLARAWLKKQYESGTLRFAIGVTWTTGNSAKT
jgi:hypothetical protein